MCDIIMAATLVARRSFAPHVVGAKIVTAIMTVALEDSGLDFNSW
jgi:hypothetical protein